MPDLEDATVPKLVITGHNFTRHRIAVAEKRSILFFCDVDIETPAGFPEIGVPAHVATRRIPEVTANPNRVERDIEQIFRSLFDDLINLIS